MHFRFVLAAILSLAAIAFAATVAQVNGDLADINQTVQTLSTDVKTFTSANSGKLLQDTTTLKTQTKKATTDINSSTTFSNSDGDKILKAAQDAKIVGLLNDIIQEKANFAKSNLASAVESELNDLESLFKALANALINKFPAGLQNEAATLKNDILAAFEKAIADYNS